MQAVDLLLHMLHMRRYHASEAATPHGLTGCAEIQDVRVSAGVGRSQVPLVCQPTPSTDRRRLPGLGKCRQNPACKHKHRAMHTLLATRTTTKAVLAGASALHVAPQLHPLIQQPARLLLVWYSRVSLHAWRPETRHPYKQHAR